SRRVPILRPVPVKRQERRRRRGRGKEACAWIGSQRTARFRLNQLHETCVTGLLLSRGKGGQRPPRSGSPSAAEQGAQNVDAAVLEGDIAVPVARPDDDHLRADG